MERQILERLRRTNPWLFPGGPGPGDVAPGRPPVPWVERTQMEPGRLTRPGKAHLVVGPRQAGKSSLVWSILRGYRRPLHLNMEDRRVRAWCDFPVDLLADVVDALGEPPEALFLEEAQWLPEAGLFIKGLVDLAPPFPLIVTGSAALDVRSRLRESMAGRARWHVLLPLSLAEVAPSEGRFPARLALERTAALRRMLEVGGYPDAWLSDTPAEELDDLVDAFLVRDASDLFQVDRLDAFELLLRLCAGQVGSLVNQAELASLSAVSAPTVRRYLSLMQGARIIELVPAFSGGKRRELTTARKVYFFDNGLRNAVRSTVGVPGAEEEDRGPRVENWVFTELAKALPWRQPIRYWRSGSGAEVDFVVPRRDRLLAIEVKAGRLGRPKLARSSRSFIEAYEPGEFWILNQELEHEGLLGRTRVRWLKLIDLPELVGAWLAG